MKAKSMTDKITVTSGWKARQYVQNLQPFRNNATRGKGPKNASLWGEITGDLYVVYSYGRHWPLWANWKGVWFGNTNKYGPTTSKHYSQTHPLVAFAPMSTLDMEYLVLFGEPDATALVEAAKLKLLPDELLGVAAQMRLAGAPFRDMTTQEIYAELKKGVRP
jgi:hypothetical protein